MDGSDEAATEIPLEGGAVTNGVVRVGATVRRPVGPWSPAVQAFLRHLEEVNFHGAPRFLGIDEKGREILTFHSGLTVWQDLPHLLSTDANLVRAAELIRDFHQASASFTAPTNSVWWPGSLDPRRGRLILHGDLAPWNLVAGDVGWTIIDWDSISPGRLEWEIAYVLHAFVPLWHYSELSDGETVARVKVFASAYGLDHRTLLRSLNLVPDRCRKAAAMIDEQAALGEVALVRLRDYGHSSNWVQSADHVARRFSSWRRLVR